MAPAVARARNDGWQLIEGPLGPRGSPGGPDDDTYPAAPPAMEKMPVKKMAMKKATAVMEMKSQK